MKKLHSHLWLFYGFGFQYSPDFFFVFDVGTEVQDVAIVNMVTYLNRYPNTGGATG